MTSHLSTKDIPAAQRLIVALDVPTPALAKQLVERIGPACGFYKIGLELFMSGGYVELLDWLRKQDKRVFCDLKFFDVPETVARAVRRLSEWDVDFATVHGNDTMLEAAAREKAGLKILAVTVLTSLDRSDLAALGFECNVEELVLSRAQKALRLGCDGVISSGLEAPRLREELGDQFLVITPGIRPVDNRPADDQKRTVDIAQAFHNGADYVVIGRPIRDAADPRLASEKARQQIAELFG